jgi:hypothetical protein
MSTHRDLRRAPPAIAGPKAGARPHCQPGGHSRRGGQQRFVATKRVSCRVPALPSVNWLPHDNKHLTPARKTTQTSGRLHSAIFGFGPGCTFENGGCTVGVTGCTPTGRGCLGAIGRCCSVTGKAAAPPAAAVFLLKSEAFPLVLPRLAGRQVQGRGYGRPLPLSSEAGRCGPRQAARAVSATRTPDPSRDPSLPLRTAQNGRRSGSTTAWSLAAPSPPKLNLFPCVPIVPQDTPRLVKGEARDAVLHPPRRRPVLILPITTKGPARYPGRGLARDPLSRRSACGRATR